MMNAPDDIGGKTAYTTREHELISRIAVAAFQSPQAVDLDLAAELLTLAQKARVNVLAAQTRADDETVLARAETIKAAREAAKKGEG